MLIFLTLKNIKLFKNRDFFVRNRDFLSKIGVF